MLENNVICLLLDGKPQTVSRWQKFVIEPPSHSNDAFKMAESFRSESNDCFYEWLSESETTQIRIRTQKLNKNSTLARVKFPS